MCPETKGNIMTALLRNVVTARHGEIIRWSSTWDDPCLSPLGVWQAMVLGYHARFVAKLHSPTFLTSHKRRCTWTARLVKLWFPKTWLGSNVKVDDILFVSARAGDTVDDERYARIVDLISRQDGDLIVVTHHQLSSGELLCKLSDASMLKNNWRFVEKITPGGAHLLNCMTGDISQLCGSWIPPELTDPPSIRKDSE